MGKTQMAYDTSTDTRVSNREPTIGNTILTRRIQTDKALHQLPHTAVKVLDAPKERASTPLAALDSARHNGFIRHVSS
jgi:hypothetical protein